MVCKPDGACPWGDRGGSHDRHRHHDFTVIGMTCEHCVRSVRDELTRLDGVSTVDVDLPSGRVTSVQGACDEVERGSVEGGRLSAFDEAVGIRRRAFGREVGERSTRVARRPTWFTTAPAEDTPQQVELASVA